MEKRPFPIKKTRRLLMCAFVLSFTGVGRLDFFKAPKDIFVANLDIHIETTKQLAARRQIDAAIEHLHKSEFECAITLAAAAEGLLPDTDKPYVFARLKDHPSYKNKEVNFNDTITWLKHPVQPETTFIFEMEAALIIARAMSKFAAVYDEGSSYWGQFLHQWGVAKGYWPSPSPPSPSST
jgi:hypothetical protein